MELNSKFERGPSRDHSTCEVWYPVIEREMLNPLLHNNAIEISHVENIMENGAFAMLEQMLHLP